MATITSSVSAGITTYTITDVAGNTATVTGPAAGSFWKASTVGVTAAALLADGLQVLDTLIGLLRTGLRPNVIPGTNSFSN